MGIIQFLVRRGKVLKRLRFELNDWQYQANYDEEFFHVQLAYIHCEHADKDKKSRDL